MPDIPTIPSKVTVHLGAPSASAPNITLSFADYIKNVASSEVFPTWDEDALRANIWAQISFTLNRIYTEYYRSRGYDFDITNDISIDQSFVNGRDVFENISRLVDEQFNSYIRREGNIEPLFAVYCDGVEVKCGGLEQWGSQTLAQQGLSAEEILKRYYGNDIEIVRNVPIEGISGSAPAVPLREGSSGPNVQIAQIRLNRIATDFPAIPKIYPPDGIFGPETTAAVKAFQEAFSMTADGIIGPATWYRIQAIFNSVKRLNELTSEGLTVADISTQFPRALGAGDSGNEVRALQYFLAYIAQYVNSVPPLTIDGSFGPSTEAAVRGFQRTYGINEDGVVGEVTWDRIYNVYLGLVANLPASFTEGQVLPFPGTILRIGSEGEDVRVLQNYLNYIAKTYPEIPTVTPTGYFGTATANATNAFASLFGIEGTLPSTVGAVMWDAIADVYQDLYVGSMASEGQFPGYSVS